MLSEGDILRITLQEAVGEGRRIFNEGLNLMNEGDKELAEARFLTCFGIYKTANYGEGLNYCEKVLEKLGVSIYQEIRKHSYYSDFMKRTSDKVIDVCEDNIRNGRNQEVVSIGDMVFVREVI